MLPAQTKGDNMDIQPNAAAPAAAPDAPAPKPARPNMVVRFLHWYWGKREEGERGNPVSRTLVALVLVALGVAGSEGYQWLRGKVVGPDDYLVGIKDEQQKSFEKLQAGLDALGASIDGGNRDAVSQVKGAVAEIQRLNSSLMARYTLANAENQRLANVVGVPGGLDIILTEDTGMPLDAQSEVGVRDIRSNGAYVSVTALQGSGTRFLRSGEAMAYTGADGRNCRLILRSVDDRSAVSLANRCA